MIKTALLSAAFVAACASSLNAAGWYYTENNSSWMWSDTDGTWIAAVEQPLIAWNDGEQKWVKNPLSDREVDIAVLASDGQMITTTLTAEDESTWTLTIPDTTSDACTVSSDGTDYDGTYNAVVTTGTGEVAIFVQFVDDQGTDDVADDVTETGAFVFTVSEETTGDETTSRTFTGSYEALFLDGSEVGTFSTIVEDYVAPASN
ncbi:MAG: hypothetical protein E1N59_2639 [Puniceicoccaceae bacterium 5H]|nr:MAG: hypothetical protein E1N59_2639 [Puniceicoccaceae bacterium 5H]